MRPGWGATGGRRRGRGGAPQAAEPSPAARPGRACRGLLQPLARPGRGEPPLRRGEERRAGRTGAGRVTTIEAGRPPPGSRRKCQRGRPRAGELPLPAAGGRAAPSRGCARRPLRPPPGRAGPGSRRRAEVRRARRVACPGRGQLRDRGPDCGGAPGAGVGFPAASPPVLPAGGRAAGVGNAGRVSAARPRRCLPASPLCLLPPLPAAPAPACRAPAQPPQAGGRAAGGSCRRRARGRAPSPAPGSVGGDRGVRAGG